MSLGVSDDTSYTNTQHLTNKNIVRGIGGRYVAVLRSIWSSLWKSLSRPLLLSSTQYLTHKWWSWNWRPTWCSLLRSLLLRSLLRYIWRSLLRHCNSITVSVKAHAWHINGSGGIGGGHFALCARERGEKLAVQQRWLFPPEPRGHVAGHPEVRVLSTRFA